jgi:signal-transduction protein with cAMP-binding, CBS, and nucleotidyltransferase domain
VSQINVDKIMAPSFITVEKGTSVFEATQKLNENRIGAMGVMDNGNLVGMFSERDLVTKVVSKKLNPESSKIEDIMTSPVLSVNMGSKANEAMHMMLEKHIRHLPVVDENGKPLGMLGIRDVLKEILNETISAFMKD